MKATYGADISYVAYASAARIEHYAPRIEHYVPHYIPGKEKADHPTMISLSFGST